MNRNFMFGGDVPIGLGMELARNPQALECFNSLSLDKRKAVIEGTHGIKSKEQMRHYVSMLTTYTGLN